MELLKSELRVVQGYIYETTVVKYSCRVTYLQGLVSQLYHYQ